jgi:hypothetical protein
MLQTLFKSYKTNEHVQTQSGVRHALCRQAVNTAQHAYIQHMVRIVTTYYELLQIKSNR